MEKAFKQAIIKLMVDETNSDFVLALLIENHMALYAVGEALLHNISIKNIMGILSDIDCPLNERLMKLELLYNETAKKEYERIRPNNIL